VPVAFHQDPFGGLAYPVLPAALTVPTLAASEHSSSPCCGGLIWLAKPENALLHRSSRSGTTVRQGLGRRNVLGYVRLIRFVSFKQGKHMTAEDHDGYLAGRRFVTVKEAARYLGVSYYFVWKRLGTDGGPPSQKMGTYWKIPKDEFIEWAKQPVIR
jgi:excisionase family DNA binding protein